MSKVVCIIRSLRFGGAERQFVGLVSMLAERGHDVTVLTYRDGDFYAREISAARVKHIKSDMKPGMRGIRILADLLRQCNPDVVITFMPGAGIKASLAKLLYRLPYSLVVSDRNLTTRFNPLDPLKYRLFRQAERWVPNSYAQAEYLRRHYPSMSDRIVPITNFCDTDYFRPDGQYAEHSPLRVVTAARLSSRKNVLGWLDAVAQVARKRDDFVVEWVGCDGDSRFYRKVVKRIEALGLGERVVLSPKTKNVLDVYRNADIFCLPSFYEGTPNALCEALACGVPAICSNVSDNALYVQDGRSGFLFDPSDVQSMAGALDRMLSLSFEQRRAMSGYAADLVASKMSKQAFIASYEDLIASFR